MFVSQHGNVFMHEIAEHLAEAVAAGGREVTVITDELPVAGGDPLDQLVVAPHEFFGLFPGHDADVEAAARHSASINTEQAGTPFFERAMHFARRGPVVFDINPFSLAAIRRLGLPAVHLPLGYVPSMDHWRRGSRERHVDIAFLAGRTPRRELFLGGAASVLWEWRTELRVFSWHRPILGGAPSFLAGDAKFDALADTRILLNVHRGDDPYFEWARVLEAAANGCVVVTETSTGTAPLVPGEHFVEAPLEYLAEHAVALALDEPRRAAIADAAHDLLTGELDQQRLLAASLEQARHVLDAGLHGGRLRRRPARPDTGAVTARGRQLLGRAARAVLPGSGDALARRSLRQVQVENLKRTYLAQVDHTRALQRARCLAVHGEPDPVTLSRSAAYASADPVVSVVIPLFDQGRFLAEAVGSVAAACGGAVPTEVIVVDDASTDDSADVALRLLDELAWMPITVARRAANGGLSAARNTGIAAVRGRYVLTLDADNLLYPNGLELLVRSLDAACDDVVAVYGILERFDADGSVGVTSHLPWDVDLLVQGAYIDAMALFRRTAFDELGGYEDPPGIGGWEDYDWWLRAAEDGRRAQLVPSVVGRYREHPGSMRRISDIDMAGSFVTLRNRHPRLPWPS